MLERGGQQLFARHVIAAACFVFSACDATIETADTPTLETDPPATSLPVAPELLVPGETYIGFLPRADSLAEFVVRLQPGEALQIRIEQRNLDIEARLFEPRGELVLMVDSLAGDQGPERVCSIAEVSGLYRLGLKPFRPSQEGSYHLTVESIGSATASDQACWEAARASAQAQRLAGERGPSREVVQRYEAAAAAWKLSGQVYQEGLIWAQLGRLHSQRGDVPAEKHSFEEALSLFQQSGSAYQEVQVLADLSHTHALRGDLGRAEDCAQQALAAARRVDNPRSEATARNALAKLQISRGEAHLALEQLDRMREIWHSETHPGRQAEALYRLGIVYAEELGHYLEAIDVLQQAQAIWRKVGQREEQAYAQTMLGWAHYRAGDPETGIHFFQQAIEGSQAVGSRATLTSALDRMGTAFKSLGRYREAREAYEQALALAQAAGNRLNVAHTRGNIGWLLFETGRLQAARTELDQALQMLRRLGDRDAVAHVLVGLAATEHSLGNVGAARRQFESAFEYLDSLRRSALRQGGRLPPDPLWQDYFERYIDLLMDLKADVGTDTGPSEAAIRAFETAELVRSRNLYEILLEAEIDLRADGDPKLLDRERELLALYDAIERRRRTLESARASSPAIDSLAQRQRALGLEIERVREAIRASSPRFSEIWDPRPVELAQIQTRLPPGARLLSFVLGSRRSFLFVVGANEFEHYILPPRQEIERRARAAYSGLSNSQKRTQGQTRNAVAALAQALFSPLEALPIASQLVVVADGALSYVPFAALPQRGSDDAQLVDAYEIVQLPSAAVLTVLAGRGVNVSPKLESLAVLADPVFLLEDPRIDRPEDLPASKNHGAEFDRLPYTRQEAEAILSLVDPPNRLGALGFDASRQLVVGGDLRDFSMIHFATHAVIDEEQPGRSRIVLSQLDRKGQTISGDLFLAEIYALDLPAELVVLSACKTALGREVRGDGLIGLARGFFYAGAKRLLVSLWEVDDQATAALMEAFYQAMLREKLSPAAALRQAQRAVCSHEQWSSAYYWAGFVLQGAGG